MIQPRPIRLDDVPKLHELVNAIETEERNPYTLSRDELLEILFKDSDVVPETDARVWLDEADRFVAWALSSHHPSGERLERVFLAGGVHPDHLRRGLGSEVLGWQIARGEAQLAGTDASVPAYLAVEAYSWQAGRERLAVAHGFAAERWFDELQRPLDELPPLPELAGVDIRPWQPEDTAATGLVSNAAFADHWGSTPRSADSWAETVVGRVATRLDVSFVAVDQTSGEVVGYSLNSHYPEDEAITGRRDGWIDSLGTLREHRGRGIASGLIAHSLHAFAEAGMNSSMLGVDTDNPSGAYGIYERLGYRPQQRMASLLRWVRPESDPVAA